MTTNTKTPEITQLLEQEAVNEILQTTQGRNPSSRVFPRLGYLAYEGNIVAIEYLKKHAHESPDAAEALAQATLSMDGVEHLLRQGDQEEIGDMYGGAKRRGKRGDGHGLYIRAAKNARTIGKSDEMQRDVESWYIDDKDKEDEWHIKNRILKMLSVDYEPTNDASLGFVLTESAKKAISDIALVITQDSTIEQIKEIVQKDTSLRFGTDRAAAYQAILSKLSDTKSL